MTEETFSTYEAVDLLNNAESIEKIDGEIVAQGVTFNERTVEVRMEITTAVEMDSGDTSQLPVNRQEP